MAFIGGVISVLAVLTMLTLYIAAVLFVFLAAVVWELGRAAWTHRRPRVGRAGLQAASSIKRPAPQARFSDRR